MASPRRRPVPEPRGLVPALFGPVVGHHPGWVTTQGEVLAGLFADGGYSPLVSSRNLHPVRRAADHAVDLVRWRRSASVVLVSVFSGRGFALASETIGVAAALRLPTVAWLHSGDLPEFGQRHPRWTDSVLRRADAVVAPTAFLARWSRSRGHDARVIPNVLDLADHPYRDRLPPRPRILWMRTFHPRYDPGTALRTLAALRRDGTDAHMTMAGQDAGLLDETRSLADDLGLSDVVAFPGFLAGEAKRAAFAEHDIFLNSNIVDNAPVTVLEAAASGLVIVSTDVGGLPDLLPSGAGGLLSAPGEPRAMARNIAAILADPALAARLRLEARRVAEASAWPSVRDAWLDLMGTVLAQRSR